MFANGSKTSNVVFKDANPGLSIFARGSQLNMAGITEAITYQPRIMHSRTACLNLGRCGVIQRSATNSNAQVDTINSGNANTPGNPGRSAEIVEAPITVHMSETGHGLNGLLTVAIPNHDLKLTRCRNTSAVCSSKLTSSAKSSLLIGRTTESTASCKLFASCLNSRSDFPCCA